MTRRVALAGVVQLGRNGWDRAPGTGSIGQILVRDEDQKGVNRRFPARSIHELATWLAARTDERAVAMMLGLPELLAAMAWVAGRRHRADLRGPLKQLVSLLREHRVVAIDHLLEDSIGHRTHAMHVDPRTHWSDAWTSGDLEGAALWIAETGRAWLEWSDNRIATGDDPVPHRALFASDVSALAAAAGMCVTWQGIAVDVARLERGLEELPHRVEADPGRAQFWETLQTNYEQVLYALDPATYRIYPTFRRQRGHRLQATPAIQAFTHKGGDLSSRGLFIPDQGCRLVEIDVRQAEPFALGLLWDVRYGDSRYLHDVTTTDIHRAVGDLAFEGDELDPDTRRAGGKTINMALTNGGGNRRITTVVRQAFTAAGAPISEAEARRRAEAVIERLETRYALRAWREELTEVSRRAKRDIPSIATLPYGRSGIAESGPQFASRLTQTFFADAFGLATFDLVARGYPLAAIVFDSILVSLPIDHSATQLADRFAAGFRKLLGNRLVRTNVIECPERWSSEAPAFPMTGEGTNDFFPENDGAAPLDTIPMHG